MADRGLQVDVVESRDVVGGLCHDHDRFGFLMHAYGPHVFHTSIEDVWKFLSRFTPWTPYRHVVRALWNGMLVPIPVNRDTFNLVLGRNMTTGECEEYLGTLQASLGNNARDSAISRVGTEVYEALFEGYTHKQWGVDAAELLAEVTKRIPVRSSGEDSYFTDQYQAMPTAGYTAMIANMLDHAAIRVSTGETVISTASFRGYWRCFYTGPLDILFGYAHGPLRYRSLRFEHSVMKTVFALPYAALVYSNPEVPYTRRFEHKRLTAPLNGGGTTVVTSEYPTDAESWREYMYPFMSRPCMSSAAAYLAMAKDIPNLVPVGRLAEYRYYNMDVAVSRALAVVSGAMRRL